MVNKHNEPSVSMGGAMQQARKIFPVLDKLVLALVGGYFVHALIVLSFPLLASLGDLFAHSFDSFMMSEGAGVDCGVSWSSFV